MSLFKKLSKRIGVPVPGGKDGKYSKLFKIGGALAAGPALGPVNPFSMDKDVLGARGSFSNPGLSVDRAKEYKTDARNEAAAEVARSNARDQEERAQADAKRMQEGQLAERRRKKRFAYGYDRASNAGGLGGGGADGGQKTLLGY